MPRRVATLVALLVAAATSAPFCACALHELQVACRACEGVLAEMQKHVAAQRHRLGLGALLLASRFVLCSSSVRRCAENAVSDALERVCEEGHHRFTTHAMPPLKMKQG